MGERMIRVRVPGTIADQALIPLVWLVTYTMIWN